MQWFSSRAFSAKIGKAKKDKKKKKKR